MSFVERLQGALWLDSLGYAQRILLAGAPVPWETKGALIAFLREADALLRSTVVSLDVKAFFEAFVGNRPELREAMLRRSRTTFALKTLLADRGARSILTGIVEACGEAFPNRPLALVLPSSRSWPDRARRAAGGDRGEPVSDDDVDQASMLIAAFLRAFAESPITGVLLVDDAERPCASSAEAALYRSVRNVVEHYRWALGLHLGSRAGFHPGADEGFGFTISGNPPTDDACRGLALAPEFWLDESPGVVSGGDFVYAVIPPGATPEAVLAQHGRLVRRAEP